MLHVLFCGNDGVFDGVLTASLSLVKRSDSPEPFTIHLFTMDLRDLKETYRPISDRQVAFLQEVMKKYNPENLVKLYDVTSLYREYFSGCPNEGAYCSPYTLIRLLADLVPGMPEKILYLDADILFNRDVHLLYDRDIDDYEYAAAPDHYGKYLIHPHYINAGVLLLNLKKMRETRILEKARKWLQKKKLVFADQSALIRSTAKRKILPQKFNDQKFLHRHTVIRHFSKRLFYLPYPHTENIKQWQVEKVRKRFHYTAFDDILDEYLALKAEFDRGAL